MTSNHYSAGVTGSYSGIRNGGGVQNYWARGLEAAQDPQWVQGKALVGGHVVFFLLNLDSFFFEKGVHMHLWHLPP